MSEPQTMQELTVTIRTEGSLLTLTPLGLLQYYLPQAQECRPGVWKGKSSTGKDCYLQTEVLAGALMECKEKELNPITQIYILPSNDPDKKGSFKVKYSVGLERMREMPGFLGLNSGLILLKGEEIKRTPGRLVYPGWDCWGAWAKAYFEGMPEPIEHEVSLEGSEVAGSPTWKDRPGFMLLKVVEDELWRLKVLPRMKPKQREEIDGEAIILEGRPLVAVSKPDPAPGQKTEDKKPVFNPGELYTGMIYNLTAPQNLGKDGKKTAKSLPGSVTITCEDGARLRCLYWKTPTALEHPELWKDLLGKQAVMSFRELKNDQGRTFAFIETLDISTGEPTPETVMGDFPPDNEPMNLEPEAQTEAQSEAQPEKVA